MQLRDLRIANQQQFENLYPGDRFGDLLAVSNKYGIIFIGSPKGVQTISTADLESVNDDDKKLRVTAEEYRHRNIISTSNILHISLNCDESILAVCNFRNGFIFADMYDVLSLSRNEFPLSSFSEVKLSLESSIKLVDFRWNPETSGIFATCLTDKTISIFELSDSSLKILGSNAANASAICWSPKGKQLVVGKFDGTLTQHLPNLQVARVIPAPNIFQNAPTVVNIVWSSSFQFVVMYNVENTPCVVIVNAPKAGSPIFINFEDICYGSVDQKPLHYYMSFLIEWGVILCSSSSAVDIGVLALANNEWEQWNMEDSGRAELPLIGSDYTFPLGMAINITSRRNIPINDTDTVPSKPILHILVSGGILRSYYIFNLKPDAKPIMKIPEQLPESKRIVPTKPLPSSTAPILLSALKENQLPKPAELQPRMQGNYNPQNNTSGMPLGTGGPATFLQPKTLFSSANVNKPESNFGLAPKTSQPNAANIATPKFDDNLPPQIPAQVMKPTVSALSPSFIPTVKAQSPAKQHFQQSTVGEPDKKNKLNSATSVGKPAGSTALLKVFVEEVAKFNNEIAQVRAKVGKSTSIIGSDEERMALISKTKKLEAFLKSAKEATRSLNVDIHTLNGCILDSFATIEEARMMNERSKDAFYINLNRSRPLDTMRSKKMKEIRELYHYLQNQIHEVNALLDWQWMEVEEKEKKHIKSILHPPSVELVCQTLTTNKRVINSLQLQMQRLSREADKYRAQLIGSIDDFGRRSHNSTTNRGLSFHDLAKLSNAMESFKLDKEETEENYARENPPSHFKLLRNALEKRQVAKVTVSQTDEDFSRFLSPTAKLRNRFRHLSPVDSEQSEPELNEPQPSEEKILPSVSKPEFVLKPTAELPKYSSAVTFSATSSKPTVVPNFSVGQFTAVQSSKKSEILNFDNKLTSSGMTPMLQQPSFVSSMKPKGVTAPNFSSMPQPNLTIGENKPFAFSTTPEFSFNLSSGVTSTPAKSEPASMFKAVKNEGKANLKTKESLSLNPNYEDITPPDLERTEFYSASQKPGYENTPTDSPIELLQGEELSHESSDYEDDDDYYDENDIDEYDVEDGEQGSDKESREGGPVILYANETTPPALKEIQETKSEKESAAASILALNLSLKPIHSPSAPEDLSVVPVSSPPKSSFSFTSGLPSVFGQPSTPNFSVSSPTASVSISAVQSTTAVTSTVTPSTFSFATPPKSSPEAVAAPVTHSFVMPTFSNVTSSTTTSSFFGKFAATTVATSSPNPNVVSLSSTSIFGVAQKTTTTTFGTNQPTFESSKSTFEQSALGSPSSFFGSPGKSAFGGQVPITSPSANKPEELPKTPSPSGFGQMPTVFQTPPQAHTSPPFGQPTTPSSGGGLFNQQINSGFFSGLGGKPSPESANKNIFGGSNFGAPGNSSTLFGSKSQPSFQTSPTGVGGGSFSAASGSVSQSGFGGFQSASIKPGGFGGSPQFGSAPTFGSPTSTFGSAEIFGSRPPQSSNFGSSFTNASDLPTFGSLASQNNAPSFTSVMQQPSSPFGSPNPPSYGGAVNNGAANPPSFGSVSNVGNNSAFNSPFGGNTGFTSQSTSNFSQWRS